MTPDKDEDLTKKLTWFHAANGLPLGKADLMGKILVLHFDKNSPTTSSRTADIVVGWINLTNDQNSLSIKEDGVIQSNAKRCNFPLRKF